MLGGCHPIVTEVFSILWNAIGPSGGRGLSAEDIKHDYKNYFPDIFFSKKKKSLCDFKGVLNECSLQQMLADTDVNHVCFH